MPRCTFHAEIEQIVEFYFAVVIVHFHRNRTFEKVPMPMRQVRPVGWGRRPPVPPFEVEFDPDKRY